MTSSSQFADLQGNSFKRTSCIPKKFPCNRLKTLEAMEWEGGGGGGGGGGGDD